MEQKKSWQKVQPAEQKKMVMKTMTILKVSKEEPEEESQKLKKSCPGTWLALVASREQRVAAAMYICRYITNRPQLMPSSLSLRLARPLPHPRRLL